jgi:hypothetical protein
MPRAVLVVVLVLSSLVVAAEPVAAADPAITRMRSDIDALVAIGPREAGTPAEVRAADLLAERLGAITGPVTRTPVPLPNGRTSTLLTAALGSGPIELVLGAHIDTVRTSPGADDNASGVAVLLELARRYKAAPPRNLRITFALFGAEEVLNGYPHSAHHFASRQMAASMPLPDWMLSVDMVGYGDRVLAAYFEGTDPTAARMLAPATVSPRGDISDHEAFARRGVPAAFLWRPDNPGYHGPGDTVVRDGPLLDSLAIVEGFVRRTANPFDTNRGLVIWQYLDLLGRRADLAGAAHWSAALDQGRTSKAACIEAFLLSRESAGAINPIVRLYFGALGRGPDHAGLVYWASRMRAGAPLSEVASRIVESAEFASRYGSPDNRGFVDAVYRNLFGRAADDAGLQYWTGLLDRAERTRGQVLAALSESAEHVAASHAGVTVTLAYVGMLHRSPEPGGYAYWTGQLRAGRPIADLVDGIYQSAEYAGRFR